ncbi:MAG: tetratricopeptide repeat protein, partial [Flavobacteriales bacterium]
MEQGRTVEATGLYEQLVALDPLDTEARARLCKLYQNQGRFDRMLEVMMLAYAQDTMGHVANLNLGTFHRNAPAPYADAVKAEKHLRRALLTDPFDSYNLTELAALVMDQGRADEAARLCERALVRAPGDYNCNCFLGRYHHERKRLDFAQGYFERGLADRPGNAQAMIGLASVLIDMGPAHRARAKVLLEQAAQIRPDDALMWLNLAEYHINFGSSDEAARCYRRALDLDPSMSDPLLERKLRAAGL